MILTREQLSEMDEEQLRTEVLIPLFKAMGFRNVWHYHGGPLEKGKDIVMWKPGDLGERVNYGVVAKARKISGQATGTSGAGEVRFQIEQCFNDPYSDPVTTEQQRVDRCFVVCSQEIIKEAQNAIHGTLESNNLDKDTRFIDGDRLWGLIKKYLPQWVVWDNLKRVQHVLSEASPHYHIVAQTEGNQVRLWLEPKYPGAEDEHPITFSTRLEFPDTPEGQDKHEEFERHLRTGAPVTLTRPYLTEVEIPEFLIPFLDPTGEGPGQLTIESLPSPRPLLVKVLVETESGNRAALDYIHLTAVQSGTDEATFTNDHQPVPWKIKLLRNTKEKRVDLQYSPNLIGANVKRALDAVRFWQAVAEGGTLSIDHLDTGFELWQIAVPPGGFEAIEPHWVNLVEELAFIQQKTQTPLVIPDRDIDIAEIKGILSTAQKLRTGRATFKVEDWVLSLDRKGAQKILGAFEGEKPQSLGLEGEEVEEILDTSVLIGPGRFVCEQAYITEKDFEVLRSEVAAAGPRDFVSVRFTPFNECPIQAEYLNWLPSSGDCNTLTEGGE